MWRWSFKADIANFKVKVFSTYVEVILIVFCSLFIEKKYSPRMWRWSPCGSMWQVFGLVFSTYVEVILCVWCCLALGTGILHVCGGDPCCLNNINYIDLYSPRMWRWSCIGYIEWDKFAVFSTYVEVILSTHMLFHAGASILHVCGGDPNVHIWGNN